MYDSIRDMLDAFQTMPDTLQKLLEDVSQEQAQSAVGGDEGWSIVEVLCHLRDAEEFALNRNKLMRDQEDPNIIPYDQEQLAIDRHYVDQDLRRVLSDFIRLRQEHIALLEDLSAGDWHRPGQHPETGRIEIFDHTLHMVCHDAIHCAQIARQLPKST
jgi:uncharacterized damage-inducible protein DinB